MKEDMYSCPAMGKEISSTECWEYCFAGSIGLTDTRDWLKNWIKESEKFATLEEFHQICASCAHCFWVE